MAKERDYTKAFFIIQYANYKFSVIEKKGGNDCIERMRNVDRIVSAIQNGIITIDDGRKAIAEA